MTSYQEQVAEARRHVREVAPEEIDGRFDSVTLIDVREPQEFAQGAIPGSRLIPLRQLSSAVGDEFPDLDAEIVFVCAVGARSALAAKALKDLGYRNVANLGGGVQRWRMEGRSWSLPSLLTQEQRTRYSRHTALAEVGEQGQARLLDSKVLVVGAGGLGSPAALYLAAAGVGTLGIVDFDRVDASNLQRQILHNLARLGSPKVDSARQTITALNPDVTVHTFEEKVSADNVLDIMEGFDLVIDGGDNFPTRYLINDASLHLRVPVVHGAILRFEGQASVFWPYQGPCYRCLFPLPPPPELSPSCAEAGVFGVLPGVIGSIQASEALKLLLGVGEPLVGRLLIYDALDQEFQTLEVRRNLDCPACADPDQPPRLVEYDDFCHPAGSVARE